MEFYELFGVDSVRNNFYRFFSILLCIATLFMGVGYASINSISLNVSGEVIAQAQNGIFITQVNYVESNYADVNNSKIISASKTNLSSNIVLLNNSSAYITYEVTLYNSNYKDYYLYNVNYLAGNDTYSNPNISFKIDGMSMIFAGLVSVLWPLATLYAFEYMEHEGHEKIFFMFYSKSHRQQHNT